MVNIITPDNLLTFQEKKRLNQVAIDWLELDQWRNVVDSRLSNHDEHLIRIQRTVINISEAQRFTYIPKPYFQSRNSLWQTLEQRFSQKNVISPIAIVGSGGMGKTSLISQWTERQRFSGKYHTTRRMVMDDISIEASLVDLAGDLYVTVEKRKQEDWLPEVAHMI